MSFIIIIIIIVIINSWPLYNTGGDRFPMRGNSSKRDRVSASSKEVTNPSDNIGFLPARRYASAGYRDRNVSVCPSVRHAPVLCQNEES